MAKRTKDTEEMRRVKREIIRLRSRTLRTRLRQFGVVPVACLAAVFGAGCGLVLGIFIAWLLPVPLPLSIIVAILCVVVGALIPPIVVMERFKHIGVTAGEQRLEAVQAAIELDELRERVSASPAGRADAGLSLAAGTDGRRGGVSIAASCAGDLALSKDETT